MADGGGPSASTRSTRSSGHHDNRGWSSPVERRSQASGSTAESFSVTPQHKRFETVDSVFIQFLIDYAANDPECAPLFKAYLEEEVLVPRNGEDLALKVEYHLRNPDIRKYHLGPTLVQELGMYSIYDNVYPENDQVTSLPSAPIPEKYRPKTAAELTREIDMESVAGLLADNVEEATIEDAEEEVEEEGDEIEEVVREGAVGDDVAMGEEAGEEEDADEVVRMQILNRLRSLEAGASPEQTTSGPALPRSTLLPRPTLQPRPRLPSASARSGRGVGARSGRSDGVDPASLGTGRLANLYRRLHAIPTLSTTNLFPDVETVDRTGADWELESVYKDKRQPPLGARLETVFNFLAEEDVDRCMHWQPRFAEVVSYLEWLGLEDPKHQLRKASQQTRAMFNDAVLKAKVHVLFEKHHYEPTPLEITKPSKTPLRSTRLNWMINTHDLPLPSRNLVPDKTNLLPRGVPPRPASPVNTLPIDGANTEPYHTLITHEKEYWQRIVNPAAPIPPASDPSEQATNLAHLESAAFSTFSTPPTIGWIRHDPATNLPLLPDGTASIPGGPTSFARERGARRAGLQQALHALAALSANHGSHNNNNNRPLILPLSGATLTKTLARLDAPQWTPPRLATEELATETETLPTVVAYRAQARELKKMREWARLRVEDEYARERRWVTLPRNVVTGAPFVWRGLDPEAQAGEDLLRLCKGVVGVLTGAERKVPRGLLTSVVGLVRVGLENGHVPPPRGVRLAGDEWDVVGRERVPRFVNAEEVQWLRFLGGSCVNGGNWEGRFTPDTPKEKYKLFLIFATRVQKLLDDPNPEGLFSRHDARVTVEELLEVMNAGKDSSAVTKCEFQPYDACCWLDRMHDTGHIRFRLDPACYGIIARPEAEYFPEHRVLWPTEGDKHERPPFLGYVSDWGAIIVGGTEPDISPGSAIHNFFSSLAFRLGHTIAMLERDKTSRALHIQPTPVQYLRESINKWKRACTTAEGADPEPTAAELVAIRTNIIDELAANNTMLAPGRVHTYFDRNGDPQTALVRDHNWDWAATVKPKSTTSKQQQQQQPPPRRRQFWSVNRWPLDSGHLSEAAERAIKNDEHADPAQSYDPAAQDPTTDPRYTRPKLRPYREEKVQYRPGPAVYPVGDTRLQREAVEGYMVDMVHKAVGLDNYKPTWGDSLARLNPFSRPSSRVGEREDGKLPEVRPSAVPKSWDPQAVAERRAAARRRRRREEDEMEVDEWFDEAHLIPDVDVEMAGMGESWVGA